MQTQEPKQQTGHTQSLISLFREAIPNTLGVDVAKVEQKQWEKLADYCESKGITLSGGGFREQQSR